VLDRYFIRPTTVDRIRSCWLGDAIEHYVNWLAGTELRCPERLQSGTAADQFGEAAQRAGAKTFAELPAHVEPFVNVWLARSRRQYSEAQRQAAVRGVRRSHPTNAPLSVPQSHDANSGLEEPFADVAPRFFGFYAGIAAFVTQPLSSTGTISDASRTICGESSGHCCPICSSRGHRVHH